MKDVIPVSKAVERSNKGCRRNYARLIKEMNREIKNSARKGRNDAIVGVYEGSNAVMKRAEDFYVSRGYGFKVTLGLPPLCTVTW